MFFHIFIYFIISKYIFCAFFTINTQKNGKETVVTVFFPFFTIISFSNFTQRLMPYASDAVDCLPAFKKFTILPYVL